MGSPRHCGLTRCYLGNMEDWICLDFHFPKREMKVCKEPDTVLRDESFSLFHLGNLTVGRANPLGLV